MFEGESIVKQQEKVIALVGSTGYIAKQLINSLKSYKVIKIARDIKEGDLGLDLLNVEQFDFTLLKSVDYVLFTAAISSPEMCEKSYKKAYKINVQSTSHFIQQALKYQCKVIFFSSDAVYGENNNVIFNEESVAVPTTMYGTMKKTIEEAFLYHPLFKTIRLSYVISKKDKFTKYCIDCFDKNVTPEIYHPFSRNVIFIDDLKEAIIKIIDEWEKQSFNVINMCGNQLISRLDILNEISKFYKKDLCYKIIDGGEFFKYRPRIVQLNSIYMKDIINNYEEGFSYKFDKEFSKEED